MDVPSPSEVESGKWLRTVVDSVSTRTLVSLHVLEKLGIDRDNQFDHLVSFNGDKLTAAGSVFLNLRHLDGLVHLPEMQFEVFIPTYLVGHH